MSFRQLGKEKQTTILQFYRKEFNLAGQLDLLLEIDRHFCLKGKRVLEVGGSNIPRSFVFDILGVAQWISIDRVYPENRLYWPKQYKHTGVIPLSADIECQQLERHVILDGRIEDLPASFQNRFEAVVSIDAFEHIAKFSSMLRNIYHALCPGGALLAIYSVIWSSHFGHHLWGVKDKAGRTFYIESSPIPKWGHLLMRPPEMYEFLLDHTDTETADEIVYQVYHSENLNRLFFEDYELYFSQSAFNDIEILKFMPDTEPDMHTRKKLETLYPGRTHFEINSMLVKAIK